MEQIHKKRAEHLINSYLTEGELIQKSLNSTEVADLFEKGGKRAMIGEIRTWDGKKYRKSGKGDSWEEVRDTHHSKTGDHMVKVNRVDSKNVHFDVHDVEGNYVTNHKLPHSEFRENYHPSEVHEVSEHSTGIGAEHVANYHIGTQVEETSPFEGEGNVVVGQQVKIPNTLTTDPYDKRGEYGKVIHTDKHTNVTSVRFSDGTIGLYDTNVFEYTSSEPVKQSIKLSEEDRKLMNRVRQDETPTSFTPRYLMNKYDELRDRGLVKYTDSVNGDEIIKLTELGSGLLSKPKTEVSDEIDETEVARLQSQATKDIKKEEITEDDELKRITREEIQKELEGDEDKIKVGTKVRFNNNLGEATGGEVQSIDGNYASIKKWDGSTVEHYISDLEVVTSWN